MGLKTEVTTVTGFPRGPVANIPFPCVPITRVLSTHLLAKVFTTAPFIMDADVPGGATSLYQVVSELLVSFVLNSPIEVPT
jgi:hypothetical protein